MLAFIGVLAMGRLWNKLTSQWAMNILFLIATAIFVVWIALKKMFTRNKDK